MIVLVMWEKEVKNEVNNHIASTEMSLVVATYFYFAMIIFGLH
jgi:hypothetical protein